MVFSEVLEGRIKEVKWAGKEFIQQIRTCAQDNRGTPLHEFHQMKEKEVLFMDPVQAGKEGGLVFVNVEVNGRAINNAISVLPPSPETRFWKIELENHNIILASGNVWVEYGLEKKHKDYSISPRPQREHA